MPVGNGGGGNRTRVPRGLHTDVYARIRFFGFSPRTPYRRRCVSDDPATFFNLRRGRHGRKRSEITAECHTASATAWIRGNL